MSKVKRQKNRMCLCSYCIQAIKSHGEKLAVGDYLMDEVESEEENTPCEFCGEFDELYECFVY